MADFRAELAALVAAYDNHRKWTINAVFERLRQAVEHARAALAQPGPAAAADGEVAELPPRPPLMEPLAHLALERYGITWDGSPDKPLLTRMADGYWTPWHVAAYLLKRQALRPIPLSERLPGPEDCLPWPGEPDETPWCWAFVKGPLDDDSWERRPVTCLTTYKPVHTHWLPAHALPLPEVE